MESESFEQDSNTGACIDEMDQDVDKIKDKILNKQKHYEDKILELEAEIRNLQKDLEDKEKLIHEQVDIIKEHQKREDLLKRALQKSNKHMIQENQIKLEKISRSGSFEIQRAGSPIQYEVMEEHLTTRSSPLKSRRLDFSDPSSGSEEIAIDSEFSTRPPISTLESVSPSYLPTENKETVSLLVKLSLIGLLILIISTLLIASKSSMINEVK
jgi:chromosome segregation ATPase